MEQFKICPLCGRKNPPNMLECPECECDLTNVAVGTPVEEAEIQDKSEPVKEDTPTPHMIRICECGEKNPPSSRKCSKCGEDISDIIPSSDEEEKTSEKNYSWSSLDGEYAYTFVDNLTVVGRENAMASYLSSKSYVSRKHAEILIEADKLWIKNHSTTNYTYVNNEKIPVGQYVELHDGDIVGLGGNEIAGKRQDEAAYFCVRIGGCI